MCYNEPKMDVVFEDYHPGVAREARNRRQARAMRMSASIATKEVVHTPPVRKPAAKPIPIAEQSIQMPMTDEELENADTPCRYTDPEIFFPDDETSVLSREKIVSAKAICLGCEVVSQCLENALGRDEKHGIWGGMTEDERKALQNKGRHRGRTNLSL